MNQLAKMKVAGFILALIVLAALAFTSWKKAQQEKEAPPAAVEAPK